MTTDRRRTGRRLNRDGIVGVLLLAGALAAVTAPARAAAWQEGELRIVVLEGEDSVNIIGQGTAVPTVVEVRDRNDLPVAGASVVFLLGEGGTATLNAGLSQVSLATNALGQAAVTVNPLASGVVQLQVSAAFQGQTATAAIVQTNFATAAQAAAAGAGAGGAGGGGGAAAGAGAGAGAGGGGLGAGGILGIVAGGVGAAVAGATLVDRGPGAPPVASLRITPEGVGMAQATPFRFDATRSSDPDRDSLTYSWDFGDGAGQEGRNSVVVHRYDAAGTYNVTLTVSDGTHRTTSSGSVTVSRSLDNARFVGSRSGVVEGATATWTFLLMQNGAFLRGSMSFYLSADCGEHRLVHEHEHPLTGQITGPSDFVCPCNLTLSAPVVAAVFEECDGRMERDPHEHYAEGVVEPGAGAITLFDFQGHGDLTFTRQ